MENSGEPTVRLCADIGLLMRWSRKWGWLRRIGERDLGGPLALILGDSWGVMNCVILSSSFLYSWWGGGVGRWENMGAGLTSGLELAERILKAEFCVC